MKIQVTITREIIEKSLMCGTEGVKGRITENCALALALNEIIPNVQVDYVFIAFRDKMDSIIGYTPTSQAVHNFITVFDDMENSPHRRFELVGEAVTVDIPETVLKYWFDDHVKLAQAIANAPSLEVVDKALSAGDVAKDRRITVRGHRMA